MLGQVAAPPLPEKESLRIGEVAVLAQVEPHVLRYWETEFPVLRPVKTPSGQRLYSPADVETVLAIKRLLYEQGFTIAGARRQLENGTGNGGAHRESAEPAAVAHAVKTGAVHAPLLAIRAELERLLTLLSRE